MFNRLKDMARKCVYVFWMVEFFVFGEDGYELIYIKKNKKFKQYKSLLIRRSKKEVYLIEDVI